MTDRAATVQRTGRTHSLKVWPAFYEHIESGNKPFEVRRDDRGFIVGDALHLSEWDPATRDYTGRDCFRVVTYLLDLRAPMFGVEGDPPLVVLGLRPWDSRHDGSRVAPPPNGRSDG
jgi:hypothetical protein